MFISAWKLGKFILIVYLNVFLYAISQLREEYFLQVY